MEFKLNKNTIRRLRFEEKYTRTKPKEVDWDTLDKELANYGDDLNIVSTIDDDYSVREPIFKYLPGDIGRLTRKEQALLVACEDSSILFLYAGYEKNSIMTIAKELNMTAEYVYDVLCKFDNILKEYRHG